MQRRDDCGRPFGRRRKVDMGFRDPPEFEMVNGMPWTEAMAFKEKEPPVRRSRKPGSRYAKRRRGLLHHGLDRRRLMWTHAHIETAFADQWEKENNPRGGFSSILGRGILQDLMARYTNSFFTVRVPFLITQREATIVATVIQWLGTNVGMSFLGAALKAAGYRIMKN